MKKIFALVFFFCFLISNSFAFSWSGLINNNTNASTTDFETIIVDQSNAVFLSAAMPLSKGEDVQNMRLTGEVMYKYDLLFINHNTVFSSIFDLDLLKFSGNWSLNTANLNLALGRFTICDSTSVVFNQCCDGAYLVYETSKWKAGLYAGYTGLLNSLNVSMLDKGKYTNSVYQLAAAYVPLSVDFAYLCLLGANVVDLQADFFIPVQKNLKSKLYASITLSGPVSSFGSYSFAAITGTKAFDGLMLFTKLDGMFYISDFGIAGAGVEYASGKNGALKPFETFTARTCCNAGGGMQTSGELIPKLSFTYVKNQLFASVTEKIVCTVPENSLKLQGSDTSISLLVNILSDLQAGCDIVIYKDFELKEASYYSATLKASLAF